MIPFEKWHSNQVQHWVSASLPVSCVICSNTLPSCCIVLQFFFNFLKLWFYKVCVYKINMEKFTCKLHFHWNFHFPGGSTLSFSNGLLSPPCGWGKSPRTTWVNFRFRTCLVLRYASKTNAPFYTRSLGFLHKMSKIGHFIILIGEKQLQKLHSDSKAGIN